MYKLFFIFLFCFSSFLYGQHFQWEGKIVDKNTNKPIENVHVIVCHNNHNLFYISDNDGFVSIFCPKSSDKDSLVVSHLSYKNIVLISKQLENIKQIELEEKLFLLSNVEISPEKQENIIIGPKVPVTMGEINFNWGQKHVVYFPVEMYRKGTLEKVEFVFSSPDENTDTIGYRMPLMLKIYTRDTINNIPGEELLQDTIIVVPQKKNKRKITINISQYTIVLPNNGFYCGFEAFPLEWYIEQGYLTLENLSYKTNSSIDGGYAFHTPMLGATTNKKKLYQNYILGGYAKEWKNVTDMFNATLLIRLHIQK